MSTKTLKLTWLVCIMPPILFEMAFTQSNGRHRIQTRIDHNEEGCAGIHAVGQKFKDWQECGVYFDCKLNDGVYTRKVHLCRGDKSFSEERGKCVNDPSCLDYPPYPRNQGDLECARDWSMHVHPENCSNFYVCHYTGEYYTLEHHTCTEDVDGVQKIGYFDNQLKTCVNFHEYGCPNDLLPVPENITCSNGGKTDRHEYPGNCRMYYECEVAHAEIAVKVKHCEADSYFDVATKKCVVGNCEGKEIKLPEGWSCNANGTFHVNPDKCNEYYMCLECKDGNGWCYEHMETCPEFFTFDEANNKCVKGRCPQYPDLLPDGWVCETDGDLKVHPSQCRKYYECIDECPDADWCFKLHECPDGQYFDVAKKTCVEGACPGDFPKLPDEEGWECSADEEVHVFPKDSCHLVSQDRDRIARGARGFTKY